MCVCVYMSCLVNVYDLVNVYAEQVTQHSLYQGLENSNTICGQGKRLHLENKMHMYASLQFVL